MHIRILIFRTAWLNVTTFIVDVQGDVYQPLSFVAHHQEINTSMLHVANLMWQHVDGDGSCESDSAIGRPQYNSDTDYGRKTKVSALDLLLRGKKTFSADLDMKSYVMWYFVFLQCGQVGPIPFWRCVPCPSLHLIYPLTPSRSRPGIRPGISYCDYCMLGASLIFPA